MKCIIYEKNGIIAGQIMGLLKASAAENKRNYDLIVSIFSGF
jgi:hypothetical protein